MRRLERSDALDDRGIGLQLAIDGELWRLLLGESRGLRHLLDAVALARAITRIRKHGNARLLPAQLLEACGRGDRDVGKLLGTWIDVERAVGKDEETVVAIGTIGHVLDEERAHEIGSRRRLEDLQRGAQRIGSGMARADTMPSASPM